MVRREPHFVERVGLVVGGLFLFYAGRWSDAAGLAITAVVVILHLMRQTPAHEARNVY